MVFFRGNVGILRHQVADIETAPGQEALLPAGRHRQTQVLGLFPFLHLGKDNREKEEQSSNFGRQSFHTRRNPTQRKDKAKKEQQIAASVGSWGRIGFIKKTQKTIVNNRGEKKATKDKSPCHHLVKQPVDSLIRKENQTSSAFFSFFL